MTIPKDFNIWVNVKRAVANGAAVVLTLSLFSITQPLPLVAGFVFGLLGGSINDIIGFIGNKKAIEAYNKTTEEDSE